MTQVAPKLYTHEEYLALDGASDRRYEYYRGEISLMSAHNQHTTVSHSNLGRRLDEALEETSCPPFVTDQRVYSVSGDYYTYPDVVVACDAEFVTHVGMQSLINPVVVVEVLSESTQQYDRTTKFERYKTFPTLQNYILVEQDSAYIQCFARAQDPLWTVQTYTGLDGNLHIPALNIELKMADIYARVEFPPPKPAPEEPALKQLHK